MSGQEVIMSWKSIAIEIAQSVQNLNKAVVRGESVLVFRQKIAAVVDSVRLMLYSSRSLDKDAVHLQDIEIKDPHRNVLSTLAKLILSAKVVNDSTLDINGKVQRDAADVLNSVRKFVLICQTKNVKIEPVNPRLLLNTINAVTDKVRECGRDRGAVLPLFIFLIKFIVLASSSLSSSCWLGG